LFAAYHRPSPYFIILSTSLSILLSTLFLLFNPPPPPDIYTLSLHDALPISVQLAARPVAVLHVGSTMIRSPGAAASIAACIEPEDRKSTRLNSSHQIISYAVFCLKKKKKIRITKKERVSSYK